MRARFGRFVADAVIRRHASHAAPPSNDRMARMITGSTGGSTGTGEPLQAV